MTKNIFNQPFVPTAQLVFSIYKLVFNFHLYCIGHVQLKLFADDVKLNSYFTSYISNYGYLQNRVSALRTTAYA